ncbi:MAG TPA: flagellar protein FliT [Calditerricola sp.]
MSGDIRAAALRQCEAVRSETLAFLNAVGNGSAAQPQELPVSGDPAAGQSGPAVGVDDAVARAEALVAAREALVSILKAHPHLADDPDVRRAVRAILVHDEAVRAAMRDLHARLGEQLRQLRAAKRQQAAYQGTVSEAVFVDRTL